MSFLRFCSTPLGVLSKTAGMPVARSARLQCIEAASSCSNAASAARMVEVLALPMPIQIVAAKNALGFLVRPGFGWHGIATGFDC